MKKIFFLILAIAPLFVNAQYHVWFPGKAVTDSSHFNRDAVLYGSTDPNILFWDKEMDASTTDICYKIMNEGVGEELVALHKNGVKHTHPAILELNNGPFSPKLAIVYQTNEGADTDLGYILYNQDGSFSQPALLASLPGEDILPVSDNVGLVAWENNGKIWVASYLWDTQTFTAPYAVDSGGVTNPVFADGNLNYLKPDGTNTLLLSKSLYYYQGNWVTNSSSSRSVAGNCSAMASNGIMWNNFLSLQTSTGTKPTGLAILAENQPEIEYLNSPLYNYSQPAICDFMIGVKYVGFYILAYVSDSLGQNEIYGKSPFWSDSVTNISKWEGNDHSPRFFQTFPNSYTIRVNLFWESDRMGFSTIYYSHYDYLFGGIAEKAKKETLFASPCPFNQETTFSFQGYGNSQVRILDLMGRVVRNLAPKQDSEGIYKAVWDGYNNLGNPVPRGCYLVVAYSGNATQSRIIIKQ